MADGLRIDATEYTAFFTKTKAAAGAIRTRTRKSVRDSGKKYGPEIVSEGADKMPGGGGLRDDILAKGRRPTVALTSTGARLVLGKKKGPQIGRFNDGNLRHPSFYVWHTPGKAGVRRRSGIVGLAVARARGNLKSVYSVPGDRKTWKWINQTVPAGTWTEAAVKRLPEIRDDVAHAINDVMKELG